MPVHKDTWWEGHNPTILRKTSHKKHFVVVGKKNSLLTGRALLHRGTATAWGGVRKRTTTKKPPQTNQNNTKKQDQYLVATQRSERFEPVPCHHVPYLSQSLWCSMIGWVDSHHPTGLETERSVHHDPPSNPTGTLEKMHLDDDDRSSSEDTKPRMQNSTYLAVPPPLRGQTRVVSGCWQWCIWAQWKQNLVYSSPPPSELRRCSL